MGPEQRPVPRSPEQHLRTPRSRTPRRGRKPGLTPRGWPPAWEGGRSRRKLGKCRQNRRTPHGPRQDPWTFVGGRGVTSKEHAVASVLESSLRPRRGTECRRATRRRGDRRGGAWLSPLLCPTADSLPSLSRLGKRTRKSTCISMMRQKGQRPPVSQPHLAGTTTSKSLSLPCCLRPFLYLPPRAPREVSLYEFPPFSDLWPRVRPHLYIQSKSEWGFDSVLHRVTKSC